VSLANGPHLTDKKVTVYDACVQFEELSNIVQINDLYSKQLSSTVSNRNQLVYSIAYVKCILEMAQIDQAYLTLNKIRNQVKGQDDYVQGCYNLVLARLMYKVNRIEDAIDKSQVSIKQLEKTKHHVEIKNAYINHGFYLIIKNRKKEAVQYLKRALEIENLGIDEMYVVLRTNLAYLSILQGNLEDAERWCELARLKNESRIFPNHLDNYRVAIIAASIAESKKQFTQEDEFLLQAEMIASENHMIDNLKSIFYSKSYNYAEKGDYKSAHRLMIQVDSLNKLLPYELISERLAVLDLEDRISSEKKTVKITKEKLKLKQQQQYLLILIIFIVSTALVGIFILWNNIRKKQVILIKQNLELAKQEQKRLSTDQVEKDVDLELIFELEKLIFDKKLYTSPQLTLDKLARKLNTNRTYLSEAINSHYKMNYSSWIALIRMREARKLLVDANFNHFSIEGISKLVGFSSISSFNALFKKFSGLTPSQFKNSNQSIE
jgi:AraC-like DNA-binding protein